jgi:hypothetical protein
MSTDTDHIRMLNDELRQHLYDGGAIITAGIAALGSNAVMRLVNAIASFNDFCAANDPHGEHDFGAFDFDGKSVMFKIDLYEEPDVKSANGEPAVTRVLTIMLAEEY